MRLLNLITLLLPQENTAPMFRKCSAILLFICFNFGSNEAAREVTFFIQEEQNQVILVGNIGNRPYSEHLNGELWSYALLLKEQLFTLDEQYGDLYTTGQRIDREALCPLEALDQCTMQLDAIISSDRYSDIVKVNIIILDVNDNAPYFTEKDIVISIAENSPMGTRFAVDHFAIDRDIQVNSILHYHLENSDDTFRVQEDDGTLFLVIDKSLDREWQNKYLMVLVATDSGSPPLSGSTSLIVNTADVNDHCPTFPASDVVVNLSRNASLNSFVVQLQASDEDYGENAEIQYMYGNRVQNTSKQLFNLNSNTGIITLSATIPEEAATQHKLTVLATGPGCAPAVALLTININEVINRSPKMELRFIVSEKDGVVYIGEDYPLNTVFAILEIINSDSTLFEPCYIQGDSPFYLKSYDTSPNTYGIAIVKQLDFEVTQQHNITVTAKARFFPSQLYEFTLRVNVQDVNDNDPHFSQSLFETSIEENNEPGAFVIQVSATDADSGLNGAISYHLGESAPSVFALDGSTGTLTARTDLDREKGAHYTVLVLAWDRGSPPRSSTCTVAINVLDHNDNAPQFQTEEITFFIPENIPALGKVGFLNVTDADVGKNGAVSIHILNGTHMFSMQSESVILMQNASVDYETEQVYSFWVEAADHGSPPLTSRAKVTVYIVDINDNPPIIVLPESNFSYVLVLPNTSRGSTIALVHAVDYDTGLNGQISYSAVEQTALTPLFTVDTTRGNIMLEEEPQNTHCGLYQLHIKACDHGFPEPLHSIVQINIILNYSISNSSYFESLIMSRTNFSEISQPVLLSTCPEVAPASLLSLPLTVPAAIVITTISCIFCVCGALLFLHTRRRNLRQNMQNVDVELPLRINREYLSQDWNEEQ